MVWPDLRWAVILRNNGRQSSQMDTPKKTPFDLKYVCVTCYMLQSHSGTQNEDQKNVWFFIE